MSDYTHELKREENAKVLLTIKVPANKVQETYQNNLKEISKQAHIKGFRKGKAPANVLEQKFGDAIKAEATEKIIQEAMQNILEKIEEKPLHYSMPRLEHKENNTDGLLINPENDFTFTLSYDTDPKIEVADLKSLKIEKFEVEISDKDINEELKSIQERNAISTDKEGAAEANDIVTFSFVELDSDDKEVEETRRQDYTSTLGKGESPYDLDNDIIGMKAGEEKTVSKTYPDDFSDEHIAGKTIKVKITVSKVKTKDLPEIDDELAKDVSDKYETLNDLKDHLRIQLKERADYIVSNIKKRQILTYLVENSSIEIPQSAIDLQLDSSWRQFIQQYGGDEATIIKSLSQSGTSKDDLLNMWKVDAKKQVTEQLLINQLLEKEEEISDKEVEETLKKDSEASGQSYETILDYYKQHNLMPQIKYDIQQKRLFEKLEKLTILDKEHKFSFTELLEYNQELEKKLNEENSKESE